MAQWNGRNTGRDTRACGPRGYFAYLADVEREEKERRDGRSEEEDREMVARAEPW